MGFPTDPRLILRIKSKGLFFGGVPCDSMGFLSSPTHKRSALFPWGAPYGFVYTGNILCCRFSMMVLISISRGVVWGLENPERTAINHVPPIGLLLQSFLRPLTVKWYLCEKEHFCMSSRKDVFLLNVDAPRGVAELLSNENLSQVNGSLWNVFR